MNLCGCNTQGSIQCLTRSERRHHRPGLRGRVHSDLSAAPQRQHVRHLPAEPEEAEARSATLSTSPSATRSYEDVLADPNVDFVHINTPIPDHAPQAIAALKAGKHVMCTVPMATTIEECRADRRAGQEDRPEVHDGRDGRLCPRVPVRQGAVREGRTGQDPVPAGQPSAGHGRLAQLLARPAADALRHALRRPLPGADPGRGGVRLLLRLGHDPQGADRQVQFALRRRDLPHQAAQLRPDGPHLPLAVRHGPPISRELRRLRHQEDRSSGR